MTCALLCGCSPAPPPHPERWARAWINALNSHRLEHLGPIVGTSGTYQDPFIIPPQSGDALAVVMTARWRRFPYLHFEIRNVIGDAEVVVIEWNATGLAGAADQTPLPGVFVLRLRNQVIASVRGYYAGGRVLRAPPPEKRERYPQTE